MTDIYKELAVLDEARFFYDGEIYGDDFSNSLGYLPDLAWDVGKECGYDFVEWAEISDYIQIDLYESVLDFTRNVPKWFSDVITIDTETFYRLYAHSVKNYLISLLKRKENV